MKRLLGSCPSFPLSCQDLEFPASRVQVPHAGSQTHLAVTSCLFWGLLWGLQVWRPLCPRNQLSTLTLPSLSLGSSEAWVRRPTWITSPFPLLQVKGQVSHSGPCVGPRAPLFLKWQKLDSGQRCTRGLLALTQAHVCSVRRVWPPTLHQGSAVGGHTQ